MYLFEKSATYDSDINLYANDQLTRINFYLFFYINLLINIKAFKIVNVTDTSQEVEV